MAHEDQRQVLAHLDRIDVYFCPLTSLYPWPVPRPTVMTLVDIQAVFYPEFFTAADRYTRELHFPGSTRMADRVITISEFSRRSIIEHLTMITSTSARSRPMNWVTASRRIGHPTEDRHRQDDDAIGRWARRIDGEEGPEDAAHSMPLVRIVAVGDHVDVLGVVPVYGPRIVVDPDQAGGEDKSEGERAEEHPREAQATRYLRCLRARRQPMPWAQDGRRSPAGQTRPRRTVDRSSVEGRVVAQSVQMLPGGRRASHGGGFAFGPVTRCVS